VTEPGDLVAIEAPAFYASLQILERLKLKAVEIPVHPRDGIDLEVLEQTLARHPIKACWCMTSFQNPMGATMPEARKQALVELLRRHQVPLIEDDVYAELYYGQQAPKPAKAFDTEGLVMHCGSFAKSLAPGYRIGWVAAGRYAQIERLKLMTSLCASMPAQAAIADYLQHGGYDRHLRKLRYALEEQQSAMLAAIGRYFPDQTRVSQPAGGYFLWLELPEQIDSLKLFQMALAQGISIPAFPELHSAELWRALDRSLGKSHGDVGADCSLVLSAMSSLRLSLRAGSHTGTAFNMWASLLSNRRH
jgi:DNA-binding transcriptional MocR family regulator